MSEGGGSYGGDKPREPKASAALRRLSMRKSNQDGDAMAADLFADQILGGINSYATEDFCNPYAEASQARASSRASMPLDGGNPTRTPECAAIGASDRDDREKNIFAIDLIDAAALEVKLGKDKSCTGGHQGRGEAARLMTVKGVAAYLGVSISKVWRLESRGVGFPKAIRICGSTRWDRSAIDCYLDSLQAAGHSGR